MSINVGYCICISQLEFRAETEQKWMETADPTSGDVRVELSIDWSKRSNLQEMLPCFVEETCRCRVKISPTKSIHWN